MLGSIGFDNNQVSYITRELDTAAWPNNEGFAVARAIYDAINSAISPTESDGVKRADARIVIGNQDIASPTPGNLRIIDIYLNDRKVSVMIYDAANGRSVSASVAIRTKPW